MGVVNKDPVQAVSAVQTLNVLRDLFTRGANIGILKSDVAVLATDSDGSTYRLFENLDPSIRPLFLLIGCTAITAGTDFDIGAYDTAGGAVINVDIFKDTLDFSSAVALFPGTALNGFGDVLAADIGKTLGELLGLPSGSQRFTDIVATANTVGSANGTISAALVYAVASR